MSTPPQFSGQELNYLHDTHFLLTKRTITQQLEKLLAETQQELSVKLQEQQYLLLPGIQKTGKISRGENYKGLPYLILDYPRLLSKEDVFAFRTMFWWGHFFSCTLHLQGKSMDLYRSALIDTLYRKKHPDLYICVHTSPWEYHYEPDNYQLVDNLSADKLNKLLQNNFCKISRKASLDHYPRLREFTLNCLQEFLTFLENK